MKANNALPVGAVVNGQYKILKVLGQGGFGITYLVHDQILARKLALKECFPDQYVIRDVNNSPNVTALPTREKLFEQLKKKFIIEARVLFSLTTAAAVEGVVHVYTVFEANNTGYMVMEYLEGDTLEAHLNAHGPVDCIWLFTLIKPVLLALQNIHEKDLLHRDVAPDNLMLISTSGKEKLVLFDFGAVKQVEKRESTIAIAKPGYSPPEQYNPKMALTPAADIYALCATLYAMLGGSIPDDATTRLNGIVLSKKDPLIGLHELNGQIPQEVEDIISKGMQIDAARRYQSANEMAEDVERFLKKAQTITVEYYYNSHLGKTESVRQQAHSILDIQQLKTEEPGFALKKTENLPLQVSFDDAENIVRLYFVSTLTTSCTVEYYYDDVMEKETLNDMTVGSQVSWHDRPKPRFVFDRAENAPLTATKNPDQNIIRVYYRSAAEVTCKIEHYYNSKLDESAVQVLTGKVGDPFHYQGYVKLRDGYGFDCAKNGLRVLSSDPNENIILSSDPEKNIIRMYYIQKTIIYQNTFICHYFYNGIENADEKCVWVSNEEDLERVVRAYEREKVDYRLVDQKTNSTKPGIVDIAYYYESCKASEPQELGDAKKVQSPSEKKPPKKTKHWWIGLALLLAVAGCIAFCIPRLQPHDAESLYSLGLEYLNGTNREQDYSLAVQYFERAATLGHSEAMIDLGSCYLNGLGVEQSYEEALKLYEASAALQNANAWNHCGFCYLKGFGCEVDNAKAYEYFSLAAEKGDFAGQYNLGYCYFYGLGVKQNYKQAFKCFLASAEQGNSGAQEVVAFCYENGIGVEKDQTEADKWRRLSQGQ